jgi:uncharacterized membrane protein YdbT with pleckstrin-like domain
VLTGTAVGVSSELSTGVYVVSKEIPDGGANGATEDGDIGASSNRLLAMDGLFEGSVVISISAGGRVGIVIATLLGTFEGFVVVLTLASVMIATLGSFVGDTVSIVLVLVVKVVVVVSGVKIVGLAVGEDVTAFST